MRILHSKAYKHKIRTLLIICLLIDKGSNYNIPTNIPLAETHFVRARVNKSSHLVMAGAYITEKLGGNNFGYKSIVTKINRESSLGILKLVSPTTIVKIQFAYVFALRLKIN